MTDDTEVGPEDQAGQAESEQAAEETSAAEPKNPKKKKQRPLKTVLDHAWRDALIPVLGELGIRFQVNKQLGDRLQYMVGSVDYATLKPVMAHNLLGGLEANTHHYSFTRLGDADKELQDRRWLANHEIDRWRTYDNDAVAIIKLMVSGRLRPVTVSGDVRDDIEIPERVLDRVIRGVYLGPMRRAVSVNPPVDWWRSLYQRGEHNRDGAELLDDWLVKLFAVDQFGDEQLFRRYVTWFCRYPLCVAVKRAVSRAGYRADELIVLAGQQDLGKSLFFEQLFPDWARPHWYSDSFDLRADPKRFVEETAGKVIIHNSELAGYERAGMEYLKAALSRTGDTARAAYASSAVSVMRRFAMVGSTNRVDVLKPDESGQRRFSVFEVERACSVDELLARVAFARDGMWARAFDLVINRGYEPRLPPDLKAFHAEHSARHVRIDQLGEGWVARLERDTKAPPDGLGEPVDQLMEYLKLTNPAQERRLATALKAAGWENRRVSIVEGGKRKQPHRWFRPPAE